MKELCDFIKYLMQSSDMTEGELQEAQELLNKYSTDLPKKDLNTLLSESKLI